MHADRPPGDRLRVATLVCLDAIGYALTVALVTVVVALAASVATGGWLLRTKTLLFLGGFLLMGYATIRLWPSSPDGPRGGTTDERGPSTGGPPFEETRFQSFVRTLPPLRWLPSPSYSRRIAPAGKLFLGSLFVLLASYLMEAVLGI